MKQTPAKHYRDHNAVIMLHEMLQGAAISVSTIGAGPLSMPQQQYGNNSVGRSSMLLQLQPGSHSRNQVVKQPTTGRTLQHWIQNTPTTV
jgi:hypothetical protein